MCNVYANFDSFMLSVVKKVLERVPLTVCGCDLVITPFFQEPMVKISGVSRDMPSEIIELFFESAKRSGGGTVKNVDILLPAQTAIITFEDAEGGSNCKVN